jgi:hypothetical protein
MSTLPLGCTAASEMKIFSQNTNTVPAMPFISVTGTVPVIIDPDNRWLVVRVLVPCRL